MMMVVMVVVMCVFEMLCVEVYGFGKLLLMLMVRSREMYDVCVVVM